MAANPIRLPIDDLPSHLALLKAELREGHVVELVSGAEVVAEAHQPKVSTCSPAKPTEAVPDFMARLRAIYGSEPLNVDTTAWVREDRDRDDDIPGY